MDKTKMQVTEVANDGLKRAYTVVVPASDIAEQRTRRLGELGRELRLPGFRPGKIPPSVVKQRYGQVVMSEVLEQSVSQATQQILTDRGLRPAQQPKVELVNFADASDLEFKLEMELLPEIPMPDFSAIALERLRAEPEEAAIAKAIEGIAGRNRSFADITEERGAAVGEVAVCDFVGRLRGAEGEVEAEPFVGGSATDASIEVAGSGFIPGFTEQLEGVRAGETRLVEVSFPEDYGSKALAGRGAVFTVTCKGLKAPFTPPVDDALAKTIGFEDLEKLRGAVRGSLQQEYDSLSRLKVKRALLDGLAAQAGFPVPDGLVEAEFTQIWQRVEEDMKAGRGDGDIIRPVGRGGWAIEFTATEV